MPANAPAPPTNPLIAESADALATMESEAAEYFAQQDAARAAKALNPVAPALEAATAASEKPAAKAAKEAPAPAKVAPAADAKPTGKVPGAPSLKAAVAKATPAAKDSSTATAAKPASAAEAPAKAAAEGEFSDIPREYVAGSIRATNWNKLHAKADHYEALSVQRHQEAEDLRAQLEAARSGAAATPPPEVTARLTALQIERDALRQQLEAVAGERLFDAESKPRREAALAQAKAAVGPAEAARIEQLLAMGESSYRDEQIEALLTTLPALRATKLTQAVADLDRLTSERAAAAAQGGERWNRQVATYQEQEARKQAERSARATSTFDAELRDWESLGLTPEEIATARSVYSGQGATLQDAARASLWAVKGPQLARMVQDLQAQLAELEGERSKLRSAQPGVGAAGAGAAPTSGSDDDDDPISTSYAERIAKQAMRQGLRFGG